MIRARERAKKIVAKRGATGKRAAAIKKRVVARIKARKGPSTSGMRGGITSGGSTGRPPKRRPPQIPSMVTGGGVKKKRPTGAPKRKPRIGRGR